MTSNSKLARHQQHRIQYQSPQSDSWKFFNLLTSEEFFEHLEAVLPEHRERLFPPTETLSLFLTQALSDRCWRTSCHDRSASNIRSSSG